MYYWNKKEFFLFSKNSRYIKDCDEVRNHKMSTVASFVQSDDDSEESEKIDDECNGLLTVCMLVCLFAQFLVLLIIIIIIIIITIIVIGKLLD